MTSTLLNGIYTLTEKAGARARASFSKVIFEHGEEIANQVSEYSKIPAQSVYWHIAKFAPEAAVKIKNQDFAKRSGYQALYRIFTNPNIAITDKMALIARGVEDTADWMKIINEIEGTNLSLRSQH